MLNGGGGFVGIHGGADGGLRGGRAGVESGVVWRRSWAMPKRSEVAEILEKTERYLTGVLLPFWLERSPDPPYGGFLSYFDRQGKATGETTKTFLMQIRGLYTMSCCHR